MAYRSNRGLSGICDSLLYSTTPLGMLFCGPTATNTDAAKVAKEVQTPGSTTGSVVYDIVTGASPGDFTPNPPSDGFTMPWWGWAGLAFGAFAMVTLGSGSARRYGR